MRAGLRERGIWVPDDTRFLAGLHDTTTDEVRLFDTDSLPESHAADLTELRGWLLRAGELTRLQRAALLGTAGQPAQAIEADVRRRSRDWSQVRPEWGLVNNAALIAAAARAHPRPRPRRPGLPARDGFSRIEPDALGGHPRGR